MVKGLWVQTLLRTKLLSFCQIFGWYDYGRV